MMHKIINTLHISIVILINSSGSKFNKIAINIILITIIMKYRRHIVIIINFLLNSRWTENNTIIIVIIIYRRHSIIKVKFLLRARGTKNIMLIKTSFPKLKLFHNTSNNGVQSIHTNNIATSIKFHSISTKELLKRAVFHFCCCFLIGLTSENKNKKQKELIAESKGNTFEHPHTR